jgi:hypothetical protein
MATFSVVEHMRDEFQTRITEGSISPEDMPRNRIYPVGSTEGLLADHLGISWREAAQKAGPDFSFVQLFREKLAIRPQGMAALVEETKARYDYEAVLAASTDLIAEYADGFQRELASFEAQEGYRMEVTMPASGVWRSRSSSARKWLVDEGRQELRSHFTTYSISSSDLLLQVYESGVLEQNDWDARTRTVVFYVPEMDSVTLDGVARELPVGKQMRFGSLGMVADNFKLESTRPGTISRDAGRVAVNLIP